MSDRGPDPSVSPKEVLRIFADQTDPCEPLTAKEVANLLDIANRTALKQLNRAEESTPLKSKTVGSSARVWWLPDDFDNCD